MYANGNSDKEAFDAKLEFDIALIPYKGNDAWVEPTLVRMKEVLSSDEIPEYGIGTAFGGKDCEYCTYRDSAGKAFKSHVSETKKK